MFPYIRTFSVAAVVISALCHPAHSAENGVGFYLLGSKGQGAAIMPPSGIYFQKPFYS
jgi:hypothetical protein